MFQIAKFLIVKPVRVELGALLAVFHTNILADVSPHNSNSPRSHHLHHLHLCPCAVPSSLVPFTKAVGQAVTKGTRVCALRSLLRFKGSVVSYRRSVDHPIRGSWFPVHPCSLLVEHRSGFSVLLYMISSVLITHLGQINYQVQYKCVKYFVYSDSNLFYSRV